jgi:hypothetical protein
MKSQGWPSCMDKGAVPAHCPRQAQSHSRLTQLSEAGYGDTASDQGAMLACFLWLGPSPALQSKRYSCWESEGCGNQQETRKCSLSKGGTCGPHPCRVHVSLAFGQAVSAEGHWEGAGQRAQGLNSSLRPSPMSLQPQSDQVSESLIGAGLGCSLPSGHVVERGHKSPQGSQSVLSPPGLLVLPEQVLGSWRHVEHRSIPSPCSGAGEAPEQATLCCPLLPQVPDHMVCCAGKQTGPVPCWSSWYLLLGGLFTWLESGICLPRRHHWGTPPLEDLRDP